MKTPKRVALALLLAVALSVTGCAKADQPSATDDTGLENMAEVNVVRPKEKAVDAAEKANDQIQGAQQGLDDVAGDGD